MLEQGTFERSAHHVVQAHKDARLSFVMKESDFIPETVISS